MTIKIEVDTREMSIPLILAGIQKISEDFLKEKLKGFRKGKFDIRIHLECDMWEKWK